MSINFVNILDVDIETQMEVRNWRNDERIRKYMFNDHIITEEEHKNWLKSLDDNNKSLFFIVYKDDIAVGVTGIINIDYINKSTSWAFYLNEKGLSFLGLGFFIEYYFINYIFDNFEFEKLNTEVLATNPKVIKMHCKFGFKEIKIEINGLKRNNEKIDIYHQSMLKTDWEINSKKFEEIAKRVLTPPRNSV